MTENEPNESSENENSSETPAAKPSPFADITEGSVVRFGFADGVEVHAIVLACNEATGEAKLKVLPPPPNNPKKPRAAIEIREGVKFARDLKNKDGDKVSFAVGCWSR